MHRFVSHRTISNFRCYFVSNLAHSKNNKSLTLPFTATVRHAADDVHSSSHDKQQQGQEPPNALVTALELLGRLLAHHPRPSIAYICQQLNALLEYCFNSRWVIYGRVCHNVFNCNISAR